MPSKRTTPAVTGAKRPRGRPPGGKSRKKPEVTWRDRLVLNPGETVRQAQRITTGNLGQDDVEHHDVIAPQGQIVGTVVYTACTSLKPPFRTSYRLVQRGIDGTVMVNVRW